MPDNQGPKFNKKTAFHNRNELDFLVMILKIVKSCGFL